MNPLFTFDKVSFSYGNTSVLENIDFTMQEGEFVVLSGANGSGKSTMLRLLLGSLQPREGTIHRYTEDFGYVPQMGQERLYNFPITPYEMIGLNLRPRHGFAKKDPEHDHKIDTVLTQVSLREKKWDLFSTLSGGQKQRVLIAKALVSNPSFLVMDEPTIGLDDRSRRSLFFLLRHFHRSHHLSILIVTHDIEGVDEIADRIMRISEGALREVSRV